VKRHCFLLGRVACKTGCFLPWSCPILLVGSVVLRCSYNSVPVTNGHFSILFPKSPTFSPLPCIFSSSQLCSPGRQQAFLVFLKSAHMADAIHFLFGIAFLHSADTCRALGLTKLSPKGRFCSVGSECYLELKMTQGRVVRSESASLRTCHGGQGFKNPVLLYISENSK